MTRVSQGMFFAENKPTDAEGSIVKYDGRAWYDLAMVLDDANSTYREELGAGLHRCLFNIRFAGLFLMP